MLSEKQQFVSASFVQDGFNYVLQRCV